MASIIKKKIKGQTYYYYVESRRIDGKPKLVNQKYLGTAEKLLERVLAGEAPLSEGVLHSEETDFGAVALIYDIALRLGMTDMIDTILPKRKQGVSIGMYILTAVINRAANPTSKSALQEWYTHTCLPLITGHKPSLFSAQNFWNNTQITEEELQRIEEAVLRKMIEVYRIDTSHLVYDATNFFTYIDTTQKSELSKRGHCKHKRNDLRIVGLSLLISPEFAVPLLHETYPGNRPDTKEFPIMMERLKSKYEAITGTALDVTVTFDRGNNSEANIDLLESGDFKLHYVGGLRKNQATDLYEIDRNEYTPLNTELLKGHYAFRREMEVFGRNAVVVIVYNPELERGQLQGLLINRAKAEVKLQTLQQQLVRRANGEITKGKKPTVESITAAVGRILSVEYMDDITRYEVIEKDGHIHLSFSFPEDLLEAVRLKHLGKTVLFTDRKDFTNEQIITTYRSAWHIEAAFKQMKDTDHLSVRPMFHWTDDKIRVHIAICVLALRLCSLLVKELHDAGITISINQLIDELSRIKRVHTFIGDIKKPKKLESYTLGSPLAQRIEAIYNLKKRYS